MVCRGYDGLQGLWWFAGIMVVCRDYGGLRNEYF